VVRSQIFKQILNIPKQFMTEELKKKHIKSKISTKANSNLKFSAALFYYKVALIKLIIKK
jgi:hypothetical protein